MSENKSLDGMSGVEGLPHREPFLFVDRVVELEQGKRVRAERTFRQEEEFFRGHFPGEPIVPGVLLTEALAQAAGLAGVEEGIAGFRLSAIRSMKFPDAALPGERVELYAEKSGNMGGLHQFSVKACIKERIVAEGILILNETTLKV